MRSKLPRFFIFLYLCLVIQSAIIQCPEGNCQENQLIKVPTISEVNELVDFSIRKQYWYYIRKADIIYQANVDTGQEYIYFNVYQNPIGTFLAITSYSLETLSADVRTMIRLGDGKRSKDDKNLTVDPFFMEITVKNQKYVVELDQRGTLSINDEAFQVVSGEYHEEQESDKDIELADQFVRKEFWYYLDGADLLKTQKIRMQEVKYILLTYNHIYGAFLSVMTVDDQENVKTNTFVRLGDYQQPKKQEQVEQFQMLTLEDFGIMPIVMI